MARRKTSRIAELLPHAWYGAGVPGESGNGYVRPAAYHESPLFQWLCRRFVDLGHMVSAIRARSSVLMQAFSASLSAATEFLELLGTQHLPCMYVCTSQEKTGSCSAHFCAAGDLQRTCVKGFSQKSVCFDQKLNFCMIFFKIAYLPRPTSTRMDSPRCYVISGPVRVHVTTAVCAGPRGGWGGGHSYPILSSSPPHLRRASALLALCQSFGYLRIGRLQRIKQELKDRERDAAAGIMHMFMEVYP